MSRHRSVAARRHALEAIDIGRSVALMMLALSPKRLADEYRRVERPAQQCDA